MKAEDSRAPAPRRAVRLEKIEVVVNPRSGNVSEAAPDQLRADLKARGIRANLHIVGAQPFGAMLDAVFEARPDLIIVLAGDGTVRAVAARAGADGPLIAPLPGGTMNMLPKAVYGVTDWRQALKLALDDGEERRIAGGVVDGEPFFCATILGAPALWAPAREALREKNFSLGLTRARRALRRTFAGRLRYRLGRSELRQAEALVVITPLISRAMEADEGLEAAIMTTADASEAFRLAAMAVFSDWRNDDSVETQVIRRAHAWARSPIPAILDGETIHLSTYADIRFLPVGFRALAPVAAPVAELET